MKHKHLRIHTDGGSRGNPGIAGAGFVVVNNSGKEIVQCCCSLGKKTNNEAEYLGFLASLIWLKKQSEMEEFEEVESVDWKLDSKLVVEQINKNWRIKEPRMQAIADKCFKILEVLPYSIHISHVKRDLNKTADMLANIGMDLVKKMG